MNEFAALPAPTRGAGLDRLYAFAPLAGHAYAAGRNSDLGPEGACAVSKLSAHLRYRVLSEQDVVASVLAQHSLTTAEKYVQEVLWRSYWKGWLELRPAVWQRFVAERDRQRDSFANSNALASAQAGTTGLAGFDDWARELVTTGYLHNHARMWFASIWIFTLGLPWALGADFFLRHLVDADAASNTLSWRWVAGLQTPGKTYLATTDNIARYTGGRFAPVGLAHHAVPLTEPPLPPARALPVVAPHDAGQHALLLVTHEDMLPETFCPQGLAIKAGLVVHDRALLWGDRASAFVAGAAADTAMRVQQRWQVPATTTPLDAPSLIAAAQTAGVRHIVTAYAPVGPVADALAQIAPQLAAHGISLSQLRRPWDDQFWPHATKGFFAFKARIPAALQGLGLL